jgi:hypothetical protein
MRFAHRLAGATAFAVAVAAVLGTASAPAFAGDGRAALDRVPKDYGVVLSINVDRAKGSALFKEAWTMAAKNPEMQKNLDMLKAQANFEFTRDVKTLTIGINGNSAANGGDPQMVLLVEGKFDVKKIGAFAKTQGKTVADANYAGVNYITIDDGEMAVMGNYMVVTQKGGMKAAIDVNKGKAQSLKANAAFMKMLGATDVAKDLWAVVLIPAQHQPTIKASLGQGIEGFGASVDVAKGLKSKVQVQTASDAAAKALADLIKSQLPQLASTAQGMGLGGALQRLTVTNNKSIMAIAFDLTVQELGIIKRFLGTALGGP